jgi:hypothetical protein
MQSDAVARWDSQALRFCESVRSATGKKIHVSWMPHGSPMRHNSTGTITSSSKMPDSENPNLTAANPVHAETVPMALEHPVPDGSLLRPPTSVGRAMNLSISWSDTALQWIRSGFNKTVPDQQCRTSPSSWRFRRVRPPELVSCANLEKIFTATNLTGLESLRLYSVGICEGHSVSQKSSNNSSTYNFN